MELTLLDSGARQTDTQSVTRQKLSEPGTFFQLLILRNQETIKYNKTKAV
jgi:hypothetical protein